MEVNALFFLIFFRSKIAMINTFFSFLQVPFPVSQIRVTLRELNLPKVSLRASGTGSNNFSLRVVDYEICFEKILMKKVSK